MLILEPKQKPVLPDTLSETNCSALLPSHSSLSVSQPAQATQILSALGVRVEEEVGSCYTAQPGLKLLAILSQCPKC